MNSADPDPGALYDEVAEELQRAAEHARTAAQHFRDGEIPRMAAHAWAAQGHVHKAQALLARQSRQHADHSTP